MAKKFSIRKLLFVGMLSIAGLFGASSIVVSNQKINDTTIEIVNAADSTGVDSVVTDRATPENNKIYLGVISDWLSVWSGGVSMENSYLYRNDIGGEKQVKSCSYASYDTENPLIKKFGTTEVPLIEVEYGASTNDITWLAATWAGDNGKTAPINPQFYSRSGKVNTFIVQTNYGATLGNDNQLGFWTYLDNETTLSDTDTLYFSPGYKWGNGYWDYGPCWPYLVCYDSSNNIIYEAGAAGITENEDIQTRTRDGTGKGAEIYYFINVPTTGVSSMRVYHWGRAFNDNKNTYAILDANQWTTQGKNFFGTIDGSENSTIAKGSTYGTTFYNDEAKAFIRGTFGKYPDINWDTAVGTSPATSQNPGGPILPVEEYSFTKRTVTESPGYVYRISLTVDVGNSFIYQAYDYIKNYASSGCYSSWNYNNLVSFGYESLSSITIYDERVSDVTPVADKSLYVEEGDSVSSITISNGIQTTVTKKAIKYKQAGFVELRRTTNAYGTPSVQMRFKNSFAVVGSGSFVDKFEWSTTGGVEMNDPIDTVNNLAQLDNQFFEAGDIFQITNNTHWSGFNDCVSDKTHFSATTLDKNGGSDASFEITINVGTSESWWWGDSAKTRVKTTHTDSNHDDTFEFDLNSTSASGKFKVYTDLTNVEVCRLVGSTEYNNLSITGQGLDSVPTNYAKKAFITIYTWTNDGGGCNFRVYNGDAQPDGDNIKVNKTGYYTLYLNKSFKIYVTPLAEYLEDDAVYLDMNGKWSLSDVANPLFYAIFINSSDASKPVELALVNGRSGDSRVIVEAPVPVIDTLNPVKIVFVRLNPEGQASAGGEGWWIQLPSDNLYHLVWNQTTDCSFTIGYNFFTLGDQTWDSGSDYGKYTLSNTGYITNNQRAEWYGSYFNTQVVCNNGITPPGNWDKASDEYNQMCKNAQGKVWIASTEGSSQLAQAMSKYDYIVNKYGTAAYPDFIRRKEEGSGSTILHGMNTDKGHFNPLVINDDTSFATIIIIVASSISLLSITALSVLVIKKRKQKE